MPLSSPTPMFDHLLESSHRDDSNKWSDIGVGEEIRKVVWSLWTEVNLRILSAALYHGENQCKVYTVSVELVLSDH